jgi:hypothetical protein
VVVVPFSTTTLVAPWADGSAALGSSDAGADADADADSDGAGSSDGADDAEALDDGRGEAVDPGNE